jgi:hypothetical protein
LAVCWAAVGFLMMGFGLIRLLIAERRKKQSTKKQSRAATISRLLENQILRAIFLMFAGRTTGVMGHNPRWMAGWAVLVAVVPHIRHSRRTHPVTARSFGMRMRL